MTEPLYSEAAAARMPRRIQRKRTKGWRMPPGAIYVGRPTILGNPWKASNDCGATYIIELYEEWLMDILRNYHRISPKYRAAIEALRGHDLCCWCRLDHPCHADVLLRIANS